MLYEALRWPKFQKLLTAGGEVLSILVLVAALTVWYLTSRHLMPSLDRSAFKFFWLYSWLGIGLFCVCAYVIGFDGWLKRILAQHPLPLMGRISYSYYLIHGVTLKGILLIATVLVPSGWHSTALFWGLIPICYGCTLFSATLFHVVAEQALSERRWNMAAGFSMAFCKDREPSFIGRGSPGRS